MKQTINDLLLKLGEAAQEERFKLGFDTAVYQKLVKELPRLFPMPDEFYTKTAVASDYDAVLIYELKEGEHPEALRIIISLMFGLSVWEIEIDKIGLTASLRATKRFGNYVLLIRIVGVDSKLFDYVIRNDTGTVLVGSVQCHKFVPLETPREDVSPEVFYERLKGASYQSFIYSKQAYICSIAAQGLSKQLPLPDETQPALGLNYDLDLSYIVDKHGKLREKLDQILGYAGWSAVIDKKTGSFSLHTVVPVKCDHHILHVRLNILDAMRAQERLFLVADLPDRLVYRASRPSDPDHKELIAQWK